MKYLFHPITRDRAYYTANGRMPRKEQEFGFHMEKSIRDSWAAERIFFEIGVMRKNGLGESIEDAKKRIAGEQPRA